MSIQLRKMWVCEKEIHSLQGLLGDRLKLLVCPCRGDVSLFVLHNCGCVREAGGERQAYIGAGESPSPPPSLRGDGVKGGPFKKAGETSEDGRLSRICYRREDSISFRFTEKAI